MINRRPALHKKFINAPEPIRFDNRDQSPYLRLSILCPVHAGPPLNAVAIIPARFGSTRFEGKVLANQTGKFLIQHVVDQVRKAGRISDVIVATDDPRIMDAVASFGGRAAMTRSDHPSGTDRVAEVAADLDADLIVNVQGDEPEIAPADVDRLVDLMAQRSDCEMGTLACPFSKLPKASDPTDPNRVKVVLDRHSRALYFSRSLIPYPRSTVGKPDNLDRIYLHIGVYAYRRPFLMKMCKLEPTPLEKTEKLEQLRVLEHGHRIAVGLVEKAAAGIDTPEDYARFLKRLRQATVGISSQND
jgi:3-deoxy-manno-octulosonate cytidylyltransferase (CMP-KDO synthetase)